MTHETEEKVSILLVDDRPDKLLALETVLGDLGENIVKVASGESALREILKRDFAAVILDVNMPGMDGFETAALIRKRPASEHTPIIFVTSINTTETHVSRGYSLGAVDYIFAPVEPEVLRAKVAVFIDLYKKTRQVMRQSEWLKTEAEHRAEQVETRLRSLLNRLDVGVFRCNSRGRLLEANPAFLRLVGVNTLAEACQLEVELLPPEESQEERRNLHLRRKDGRYVWVSISYATSDFKGESVIDGLVEDITARKEAEEAAKRATDALRDTDKRKDQFLAMLGHELRNPLNAINSAVQLSERTISTETTLWCRTVVKRQIKHLTRIIDDLLEVSRVTQGKIQLKLENVPLAKVIQSAAQVVQPLMTEKSHEMTVSIDDDTVCVNGDPTRLEQVIVNLLTNSAKYTESGGKIDIRVSSHEDEASITVKDTGVGISEDMLPLIFEPFTQVDRTLDRSQGGLGIGLTLVRLLLRLHGGEVTARSEGLGKGSEFLITLPRSQPLKSSHIPVLDESFSGGNGKRILVVEDNEDTAKAASLFLESMGYEVFVAHEGNEAIRLVGELRPKVVLLDIGLPGVDGYQVAGRIREEQTTERTILIAVTGYGEATDRARAKSSGFDHHLVKPLDYHRLLGLISPTTV